MRSSRLGVASLPQPGRTLHSSGFVILPPAAKYNITGTAYRKMLYRGMGARHRAARPRSALNCNVTIPHRFDRREGTYIVKTHVG